MRNYQLLTLVGAIVGTTYLTWPAQAGPDPRSTFKAQFMAGLTSSCMSAALTSTADKASMLGLQIHVGAYCDCSANYVWNKYGSELMEKSLKGEPTGALTETIIEETGRVCLPVLFGKVPASPETQAHNE